MVIAVRTDTSIAATITQTSYYDALKIAFTNAGFGSPYHDFTSGTDRIIVYEFPVDNTKIAGTNYLRIRISNTLITYQQVYTSWNIATSTGTGNSVEITYTTLASNNTVGFVSLNGGSEYRLVLVSQASTFLPLGMIVPANKPDWWDLNNWSYGFIFTANTMTILRSSALNPYSNSDFDLFLNATRMVNVNPQTNRRDILAGMILLTQTNTGSGGRTSDDIAQIAGNGSSRYDLLNVFGTSQQYLVVNNNSGGMAVRVQ
jgi:hypothetical protein